MYESITYAELKSLPREQKSDAWRELKTLYPTLKELAGKLGVSPAIVYNMIARYAKEESKEEEKANRLDEANGVKRNRNRGKKQKARERQERMASPILAQSVVQKLNDLSNETFSIMINKSISGEDAQFFLNGIGSALLKDRKYSLDVKIAEIQDLEIKCGQQIDAAG